MAAALGNQRMPICICYCLCSHLTKTTNLVTPKRNGNVVAYAYFLKRRTSAPPASLVLAARSTDESISPTAPPADRDALVLVPALPHSRVFVLFAVNLPQPHIPPFRCWLTPGMSSERHLHVSQGAARLLHPLVRRHRGSTRSTTWTPSTFFRGTSSEGRVPPKTRTARTLRGRP